MHGMASETLLLADSTNAAAATVRAAGDSRSLCVKVLATPADILRHRFLWTRWPGTRDSDLDFFLHVAARRPEVLAPYVAVAYRGENPEAMLIGRLERRRVPVKFGYVRLPTPEIRVLNFVYGCLRGNGSPENSAGLVGDVLGMLRRREADLAIFEHLPVDSHLYRAVDALPRFLERGMPPEQQVHWQLQLPQNSEALYAILSPKHRQNYRRKARKLLSDFSDDVRVERYTEVSDRMFAEVESIASKTYQRALGFGFDGTPEMRERWKLAAAADWLRVSILYVQGKPCAYWSAMAYHGTLWGDHVGYDPSFSSYSPGMYLLLTSLSELCDGKWKDNVARVDFGLGDAEYKTVLSNCSFKESLVYVYGTTLRGMAMNLLSTSVAFADRTAKKFLARNDLLEKTKRLWRNHALVQSRGKA
jgi:Acetyltransferase (GNAT) domain